MIPLRLWMNLHSYVNYESLYASSEEYKSMIMYFFYNTLNNIDKMVYVVLIMAVLTVMAVFSYLFSSKSSNMMHAFPVTREELFLTNLASSLLFVLIPEFIAFLVTVLVCLANGITYVQYVAGYFLILAVASFLFLAMGLFATMLTGLILAVPVIVLVLNYFYLFLRMTIGNILCAFAYGTVDYSVTSDRYFLIMAPIRYFAQRVRIRAGYTTTGGYEYLTSLKMVGLSALGWYVFAAVLFVVLAYMIYRKRPLEKVGDLVAFPGLGPVLRWIAGFLAGYAAAIWLNVFLESVYMYMSKIAMACMTLVVGILVFFFVEMLLRKKVKVWDRHILKEAAAFAVCMLVSFGGIAFLISGTERYIPDRESIASVTFQLSYAFDLTQEECGPVIDIQKALIAHRKDWLAETHGSSDYANIRIIYTLKDKSRVERYYMVPLTEDGLSIIGKASSLERDAELFLRSCVGASYDKDTEITGAFNLNYSDYVDFSAQTAAVLIDAIREDALAGTIQKYNSISEDGTWSEAEATKYCGYVAFNVPKEQQNVYYDDYDVENYATESSTSSISFGTDCTNLIQALIDTGLIDSENDLVLYSEYE
jgi:ABC-2 type transport system permease protein